MTTNQQCAKVVDPFHRGGPVDDPNTGTLVCGDCRQPVMQTRRGAFHHVSDGISPFQKMPPFQGRKPSRRGR